MEDVTLTASVVSAAVPAEVAVDSMFVVEDAAVDGLVSISVVASFVVVVTVGSSVDILAVVECTLDVVVVAVVFLVVVASIVVEFSCGVDEVVIGNSVVEILISQY